MGLLSVLMFCCVALRALLWYVLRWVLCCVVLIRNVLRFFFFYFIYYVLCVWCVVPCCGVLFSGVRCSGV